MRHQMLREVLLFNAALVNVRDMAFPLEHLIGFHSNISLSGAGEKHMQAGSINIKYFLEWKKPSRFCC